MKDKYSRVSLADAIKIIGDHQQHDIEVWVKSDGRINRYKDAVQVGSSATRGTIKVQLQTSEVIREFRKVTLKKIDNLKIFM